LKKVLVVEDSSFFQGVLKKEIEELNMEVVLAKSIAEANEQIKRDKFDFITLDINLPDGNGFDFCKKIKNDKRFFETQVLIISAEDSEYLRKGSFDAGAFSFLKKDFIEGNLRKYLKTTMSMASIITGSVNPVVIVEDSDFQRNYLKSLFAFAKIKVKDFADSKSAMKFLTENPQVDMIIVDYFLEKGNCEGLIQFVRKNSFYNKVPILVSTILNEQNKKYDLFLMGVNDFIVKPFDTGEFFLRIRNHLRIKHLIDMLDAKNKLLSIKATTDELTGLFNRRFFWETLFREDNRSKRLNQPYSILMIDIDNFKQINDSYGHLKGDEVLVAIAETLKENMRSFDTIARFGGEEFIALLPNTDKKTAIIVAEKILQVIRGVSFDFSDEKITVSIGVSDSAESENFEKVIILADERLYKAKSKGKNRYECD
jgi:two-component system cell cycle response regulator